MVTWEQFRKSPWSLLTSAFFLATMMLYLIHPSDDEAGNHGPTITAGQTQEAPRAAQAQAGNSAAQASAILNTNKDEPVRAFAYTGILALGLSFIWFTHAFTGAPDISRRPEQVRFAYFFVIASFVVLGLPPLIKSQAIGSEPLGIVSGCVSPPDADALSCLPALGNKTASAEEMKKSYNTWLAENPNIKLAPQPLWHNQWLVNIGGTLSPQTVCPETGPRCKLGSNENRVYVTGGLVVPLPLVIVALFGAAISLTRRVPEIQKQSDENYVGTAAQPALTPTEATERLAFQIMQFVSAPLIAITAYEVLRPENEATAMALAFLAGFGSETILLLIRGVAEGIQPKITAGTAVAAGERVGTVEGVIRVGGKPVSTDVTVQGTSLKARSDADGKYAIKQVPAGLQQFLVTNNNTVQTRSVSVIAGATTRGDIDIDIATAGIDATPVPPLLPDRRASAGIPALTGPMTVGIRLAINDPDLDPGTLRLFLDDREIDIAADGLLELAVLPGVAHLLKAIAKKDGNEVTSENDVFASLDDDGSAISLVFK